MLSVAGKMATLVARRKLKPVLMTLDEFTAWEPEDSSVRRWQLIDGEPVAMAPAAENHGALQSELSRRLGNHLIAMGGRCRVITEPGIQPRIRSDRNYRIPDLAVTCAPPSLRLMMADPALIIEILSPSNAVKTWD
jgi:Uma2 family endonuclease